MSTERFIICLTVGILIFVSLMLGLAIRWGKQEVKFRETCEAEGGQYLHLYRQPGVCLQGGSILKLEDK